MGAVQHMQPANAAYILGSFISLDYLSLFLTEFFSLPTPLSGQGNKL